MVQNCDVRYYMRSTISSGYSILPTSSVRKARDREFKLRCNDMSSVFLEMLFNLPFYNNLRPRDKDSKNK